MFFVQKMYYLCTLTLKPNMEELLLKYNYTLDEESKEWNKNIWTIRFSFNEIEAFNTPRVNTPGLYYKCKKDIERLQTILDEIEQFIK